MLRCLPKGTCLKTLIILYGILFKYFKVSQQSKRGIYFWWLLSSTLCLQLWHQHVIEASSKHNKVPLISMEFLLMWHFPSMPQASFSMQCLVFAPCFYLLHSMWSLPPLTSLSSNCHSHSMQNVGFVWSRGHLQISDQWVAQMWRWPHMHLKCFLKNYKSFLKDCLLLQILPLDCPHDFLCDMYGFVFCIFNYALLWILHGASSQLLSLWELPSICVELQGFSIFTFAMN